ncbi:MAG: type II toxin-antitoxin system RelE/ParE family toxin [Acidovorax sp.]|uniref:type II toxin-antitoxin system RelE/ParE family toxin n=1 Tax=Acidovorax sp. TaxID=1872122 RepID=UPI0039E47251
MSFRFLPPAEAELLEGISYYAAIRPELGLQFEQAVAQAIRAAAAYPERGAPRSRSTRRWLVGRFPYCVIYRADEAGILIVAIAHERKRPEYWAARME